MYNGPGVNVLMTKWFLKSMDFIHYTTNLVGPLCVNEHSLTL